VTGRRFVLLPLLAVALSSGCGGSDASTPSPTSELRIALDWVPNTNHVGIYVASARGLFAQEGVRLRILPYSGANPEVLVAQGKADLGVSFAPSLAVSRAAGIPIKAVAAVIPENQEALAVLASSKVRRPAELSGKTTYLGFGLPSESPVMRAVIQADGGAPAFATAVLQTAAYEALYQGKGDFSQVFQAWEPIEARLRKPSVKLRLFPVRDYLGPESNWPSVVLVASDDAIANRADLLRRGLRALSAGYTSASSRPSDAATTLGTVNRALARAPRLVNESMQYLAPTLVRPGTSWGQMERQQFVGITNILARSGALKDANRKPLRSLDPGSLFTNSLLPNP
jgi:ABC-type nitrate/sulfonate/bicarbonate transport system substrate-binding protein